MCLFVYIASLRYMCVNCNMVVRIYYFNGGGGGRGGGQGGGQGGGEGGDASWGIDLISVSHL